MSLFPPEALIRARIAPDAPAQRALEAMDEQGLDALVVEGGGQVVLRSDLERRSAGMVGENCRRMVTPLPADAGPLEAAQMLAEAGQRFAFLSDGSALVDLRRLLASLAKPRDPHTGLNWSGSLREWGEAALESGQEISIVFFDLNDFGQYNKRFGHVVGDRVLRGFADRLRQSTQEGRDVVVRYGGDEFAIGSPLPRAQAEELAATIAASPIRVEGVPEPVGFSWGASGGKRGRERLQVHFAATVDNLINLASQDCLRRKAGAKQSPEPAPLGLDTTPAAYPQGSAAHPAFAAAMGWL
jgi:GGDEF domain-containing protein